MRAWVLREKSGPSGLCLEELPSPQPGDHELLIQIRASALNRADLLQTKGQYPAPKAVFEIPGLELAGEVISTGPGVSKFREGDRVMALVAEGGYAEQAVVPENLCLRVPDSMSWPSAGAWPEAAAAVFDALCRRAQTRAGQSVFVPAGSSGIGTFAIRLARCLEFRIAVTASSRKVERVRALGPDLVIDHEREDFKEILLNWAPGGVDVILDVIGALPFPDYLATLATQGQLVILAFMQGRMAELDIAKLMQKRASIHGSVLRSRSQNEKAQLIAELEARCRPFLDSGQLDPVIDREFDFAEAPAALDYLASRANLGKVCLAFE